MQCAKQPDLARLYISELGRCTSGVVVRRVSGGGCTSGVVVRRVSGGVQAGWLYAELAAVGVHARRVSGGVQAGWLYAGLVAVST